MEKYYQKIYESDFAGILSERTFLAETWRGTAGSIRNGVCVIVAAVGGYGNRSVQYDEQSDFRKDRYEFWKLAGTDEHGASGTGCTDQYYIRYDCKTNHEIVKKRIDEEQEGILNE